MSGSSQGWIKAKQSLIKRYGSEEAWREHVRTIAAKGGRNGNRGGFAGNPELARIAGAKGGRISRRGKSKKNVVDRDELLYKLHNENVSQD